MIVRVTLEYEISELTKQSYKIFKQRLATLSTSGVLPGECRYVACEKINKETHAVIHRQE